MSDLSRADAPALAIRGLRKCFERPAVDGLDLTVPRGSFYALLGANGAGKTTTLRMTAGLLRPDAGSIRVYGVDVVEQPLEARRIIAWLPDEPMLYDKLTPLEYLEFVSGLWSTPREEAEAAAEDLLRALDLWSHRDQRCEGFSRGMRQKTALAGALIHDPQLLILDEPLTGLDAAIARQVKDLLTARTRRGVTVILTTHILEVAERLADRIGIIHHGRLLAEGSLAELREAARRPLPEDAPSAGGAGETLEDVFLGLVHFAGERAA
jgi:ABC-2 type transport system ATP-binding protein